MPSSCFEYIKPNKLNWYDLNDWSISGEIVQYRGGQSTRLQNRAIQVQTRTKRNKFHFIFEIYTIIRLQSSSSNQFRDRSDLYSTEKIIVTTNIMLSIIKTFSHYCNQYISIERTLFIIRRPAYLGQHV